MKRTFKYRVYPTLDQQTWLFLKLKHQKRLYNYMLQMRFQMWQYGSIGVSRYDQQAHLTKLRENSHYGKYAQDMQVETIKRVDAAYQHFFRRCKDPKEKKKGAPRFKRSVRSLTWCLRKSKSVRQQPIRETGTRLDRLKVPKLGSDFGEVDCASGNQPIGRGGRCRKSGIVDMPKGTTLSL